MVIWQKVDAHKHTCTHLQIPLALCAHKKRCGQVGPSSSYFQSRDVCAYTVSSLKVQVFVQAKSTFFFGYVFSPLPDLYTGRGLAM